MDITQEILVMPLQFLPLTSNENIIQANALRYDWNDLLPASECDYIIGNPPFKGAHAHPPRTKEQTEELKVAFDNQKGIGDADYVSAWFSLASKYAYCNSVLCGLVSTSSIAQGQQPALIWSSLLDRGDRIIFAYEPFLWNSETAGGAAVAVTIIGFTSNSQYLNDHRALFFSTNYLTGEVAGVEMADNINPYLVEGPTALVFPRTNPICDVPKIGIGNKPIDGGNYLFKSEEYEDFIKREPGSKPFFHQWLGADEFIKGKKRYVLWLGGLSENDLDTLPLCKERVEAVRKVRLESKSTPTRKLADTPTRFHVENMPTTTSILIPQTSSENRVYIPLGFIDPGVFASNAVRLIPDASLYHFGVLSSLMHNAWMRVVTGRLEKRYQYAGEVVYNNLVWPDSSPMQKDAIEWAAQAVLDARAAHPGKSLADLYDPDKMPSNLLAAHKALDKAVEGAYGVDFNGDEGKIVTHLFKLYAQTAL